MTFFLDSMHVFRLFAVIRVGADARMGRRKSHSLADGAVLAARGYVNNTSRSVSVPCTLYSGKTCGCPVLRNDRRRASRT